MCCLPLLPTISRVSTVAKKTGLFPSLRPVTPSATVCVFRVPASPTRLCDCDLVAQLVGTRSVVKPVQQYTNLCLGRLPFQTCAMGSLWTTRLAQLSLPSSSARYCYFASKTVRVDRMCVLQGTSSINFQFHYGNPSLTSTGTSWSATSQVAPYPPSSQMPSGIVACCLVFCLASS